MMQKNQSSQPVRHLTHRRLTAVFFYLAILISVMISLPIMVAPRQGLADANPELVALQPMAQVSAGMAHSVFLDYDGLVYAWGDNVYGQSGSSGADHASSPVQLELPEPAQAISAGAYHTLILGRSGTVYALGRNAYGQVGDGRVANVDSPVKITGLPVIQAIAAGAYHSLALGVDGSVWAWGHNTQGQVGDVASEEVLGIDGAVLALRNTRPVQIVKKGATLVRAGANFSLYVDETGQLFAWGDNTHGQLGDGTTDSHRAPALVSGISQVIDVSAGSDHILALSTVSGYRQLYVWGDNSLGQLGLGGQKATSKQQLQPVLLDLTGNLDPSDERLLSVAAGYAQSAAVRDVSTSRFGQPVQTNELYLWGLNASHQLGLADKASRYVPSRLQGFFDGYWGSGFLPFESIAFGSEHVLVLSSKGLLATAGANNRGQLGQDDETARVTLEQIETNDLFLPRWTSSQSIRLNTGKDNAIKIKWPEAQDNTAVAGYYVEITAAGQAPVLQDAGLVLEWNATGIDAATPVQISVMAYDQNNQGANPADLARLTAYRLPEGTQGDSYFLTRKSIEAPAESIAHHWMPHPSGKRQPHEVPWSLSGIENLQVILPPYSRWIYGGAIFVLLASLWLVVYKIRRKNQSVVEMDPEREVEAG
ncbi:MAG: hypothetical protein EOM70_03165 [Clostridia bacterium]|nr:hypothetical protein [Clostridia bacterium]